MAFLRHAPRDSSCFMMCLRMPTDATECFCLFGASHPQVQHPLYPCRKCPMRHALAAVPPSLQLALLPYQSLIISSPFLSSVFPRHGAFLARYTAPSSRFPVGQAFACPNPSFLFRAGGFGAECLAKATEIPNQARGQHAQDASSGLPQQSDLFFSTLA